MDKTFNLLRKAFVIQHVSVSVLPCNLKTQRSMQSCANCKPWFIVCEDDCIISNSLTQKH